MIALSQFTFEGNSVKYQIRRHFLFFKVSFHITESTQLWPGPLKYPTSSQNHLGKMLKLVLLVVLQNNWKKPQVPSTAVKAFKEEINYTHLFDWLLDMDLHQFF